MISGGNLVVLLLGLVVLVWSKPAEKAESVRGILATIYSDYPEAEEKIDQDEVAKVLNLNVALQMQALKAVLNESGLDLGDLDDYFTQDTMLTQESSSGNETLVSNTTIVALPGIAVIQQTQETYDEDGEKVDGAGSVIQLQIADDGYTAASSDIGAEPLSETEGEADSKATVDNEVSKTTEDDEPKVHSDEIVNDLL